MEILIVGLLMFLPFVIACVRGSDNVAAVFLVNLFLGWTGIGWFVALFMAINGGKKPQVVYITAEPTSAYTPTVHSDWGGARRLVPLVKDIEGVKHGGN